MLLSGRGVYKMRCYWVEEELLGGRGVYKMRCYWVEEVLLGGRGVTGWKRRLEN